MHMTTASQQKNRGDDKHWLVMNELSERFGPVNFETLKLWAKDGRLAPTNTVSEDEKTWTPVTQFADLEMVWVAEVSPGAFYGPIHKQALEALKKEGAIPTDAITFQRAPTDLPISKTQPIPSPAAATGPLKKEETEVVTVLERQLDLERQRSHDIMKQLQQVEIHVAASEARAEACEKAHKHYAGQTEQAQQHLTTQLDQTNKQLTHIHAQLLSREQELHRTEQRLASFERIETLLKECMLQMTSQQQELKTVITATQENTSLSAEPIETVVKAALAQLVTQQQELKVAVATTQGSGTPSTESIEAVVKNALAQLTSQQQELKASFIATQENTSLSAERGETVLKDAMAQLVSHQLELKAAVVATQSQASLSAEHGERALKDAMVQLTSQQQELKAAVLATQDQASLSVDRGETVLKNAMAQLTSQQQELKATVLATQESATLSAERLETLVKETIAHLTNPQQVQSLELLLEKMSEQLTSAFTTSQTQLLLHLSQALKQETPPLLALLTDQGLALQRLSGEFNAVGAKTVEATVSAVTAQLDKAQEETVQQLCTKLEDGRAHLLERTQNTLSQWQEQLMRVTGESQRLTIEYIVRELTAKIQELKTALEKQLATPPPPTVKRTYVEAEVVEVTPSERVHKKTKPSPEVSEPSPAQHNTQPSRQNSNPSMADIEQQARRELERLGAQGMNIFKRKS